MDDAERLRQTQLIAEHNIIASLIGWFAITTAIVLLVLRREPGTYKRAMIVGAIAGIAGQILAPILIAGVYGEEVGLIPIRLAAISAAGTLGSIVGAIYRWAR